MACTAIETLWTSRIGDTAKTLLLALAQDDVLLDFADFESVELRMRLRSDPAADIFVFPVTAYAGGNPDYNAEVVFEFDTLVAGLYSAEVVATLTGGTVVTFPDDERLLLRFWPERV